MTTPYFLRLKFKGLIYIMNERNIEKKYCVYMHMNKINNKFYIGITSRKPEQRWGTNGCNYSTQIHFWRAIQKYGWDNFEHIILLDQLTKDEACTIEVLLIALFNTQNPDYGYNVSPGGDVITFELQMSDETKNKISKALKGRRAWNKGIKMPPRKNSSDKTYTKKTESKKRNSGRRSKKIAQYDLNGNFIRMWDCMSDAARAYNISHTCISDCCRDRQKTAGGFIWRYFNEEVGDKIENIGF